MPPIDTTVSAGVDVEVAETGEQAPELPLDVALLFTGTSSAIPSKYRNGVWVGCGRGSRGEEDVVILGPTPLKSSYYTLPPLFFPL